jgi:hypothetical protein
VSASPDRAVGAAWALSLLSAVSSLAFAAGAVAGWTMHLWPATPVTLGAAAGVVIAGPLASALLLHAIRADGSAPRRAVPAPVPVPVPVPAPAPAPVRSPAAPVAPAQPAVPSLAMTPDQAWGRALMEWRDRPRPRRRA